MGNMLVYTIKVYMCKTNGFLFWGTWEFSSKIVIWMRSQRSKKSLILVKNIPNKHTKPTSVFLTRKIKAFIWHLTPNSVYSFWREISKVSLGRIYSFWRDFFTVYVLIVCFLFLLVIEWKYVSHKLKFFLGWLLLRKCRISLNSPKEHL